MKESVRKALVPFLTKFDGCVPWMHLDKLGLVVVGLGCQLEPIDLALGLKWFRRGTEERAEMNEISRDWTLVKRNRLLAHQGPQRAQFFTGLDLSAESLDALVFATAERRQTELEELFCPTFEEYPADAQLAILSMVWALPSTFALHNFPKFTKPVNEQCWTVAAQHCFLPSEHRPELVPRNWANRKLLTVAGQTEDPDKVTGWAPSHD